MGKARVLGAKITGIGARLASKTAGVIDKALLAGAPLAAAFPELAPIAAGGAALSAGLHAGAGVLRAGNKAFNADNAHTAIQAVQEGVREAKSIKPKVNESLEKYRRKE